MEFPKFGRDFLTRHSVKPKGEDRESPEFPGISEKGVDLARERTRKDIMKDIQEAEKGTVLLMGPISEMPRTRSTAQIYGQEIKKIISEQNIEDILIFDVDDIKDIKGFNNKINFLVEKIKDNPNKKIIIDIPLFMKEFTYDKMWVKKNGELTDYGQALDKKYKGENSAALLDWLENQGKEGELIGPNPNKIAENHLQAFGRIRDFAKKYIKNRPLDIGGVGHAWNLDAVAIYLANDGKIDKEAIERIKPQLIGETKRVRIIQSEEGKEILEYGDLKIPLE